MGTNLDGGFLDKSTFNELRDYLNINNEKITKLNLLDRRTAISAFKSFNIGMDLARTDNERMSLAEELKNRLNSILTDKSVSKTSSYALQFFERYYKHEILDLNKEYYEAIKRINEVKETPNLLNENYTSAELITFLDENDVTPEKPLQHVFLTSSLRYINDFIEELKETATPESRQKLENIKTEAFYKIVKPGSKKAIYNDWLLVSYSDEGRTTAIKSYVRDRHEPYRQEAARQILSNAMYDALWVIEKDKKAASSLKEGEMRKTHKEACQGIAAKKADLLKKSGKITFDREFGLLGPHGLQVNVKCHLEQLGETFNSSLTKRLDNAGAINTHLDKIKTVEGDTKQQIENTEFRTGSFDYSEVKLSEKDEEDFSARTKKAKLDSRLQNCFTGEDFRKFLGVLRVTRASIVEQKDPDKRAEEIAYLEKQVEYLDKKMNYQTQYLDLNELDIRYLKNEVVKYKNEIRQMHLDQKIISKNVEVIKETINQIKGDEKFKELGIHRPDSVKKYFIGREKKLKLAMVSLQTPSNVSQKGRNKLLPQLKNAPGIGVFAKKLMGPDLSELNPIYREMRGLEQAVKEVGDTEAMYLNIPTNALGKSRLDLTRGIVDNSKVWEVQKKTLEGFQTVYDETTSRINELQNIENEEELENNDKMELIKYRELLKELSSQIFVVEGNKVAGLQPDPGKKAVYEVPARLNTLMKLCGYTTTFHCRSGNNRTAAMAAKSHQLAMVLGAEGKIPPAVKTAGGKMEDGNKHWSDESYLKFYQTSLTLQQANKGTRGTKIKVSEYENEGERVAFTKGAFDIAGAFRQELLDQAKKREGTRETGKTLREVVVERVRAFTKRS